MPKQVIVADKQQLANVALPQHGGKYTVVGHKFIIDEVLQQLNIKGFTLDKEEYKMNLNGEVAQGVYHLNYGNDPDLGLMFAWANSYDKTMRFRCAIGGYVFVCGNGMIAGDMSNYGRKHVGDAKEQVKEHIESQISNANAYFNGLIADKDLMKTIMVNEAQVAKLMGTLYFKEDVITSSQLINIKAQYKKPDYSYNAPVDSLWTIYNHVTLALKNAHPKTWMEQQKDLHAIMRAEYFPNAPVVDPNQTNIIAELDEHEQEEIKNEPTETITADPRSNEGMLSHEDIEIIPPAAEADPGDEEHEDGVDLVPEDKPAPVDPDFTEADDGHGDVIDNQAEQMLAGSNEEFPAAPADLPVSGGPDIEVAEVVEKPVVAEVKQPESQPEEVFQLGIEVKAEEEEVPEEPTVDLSDLEGEYKPEEVDGLIEVIEERVEAATSEKSLEEQLIAKTEQEIKEATGAESVKITLDEPDPEVIAEIEEIIAEEIAAPLEEQIASETIQPVSQEEKAVSAEPIVEQPKLTNDEGKLQPNPNFESEVNEMPEALDLEAEDDSNPASLESPEFEF